MPKAEVATGAADDGIIRKSGPEWYSKFMFSDSLSDLVEPFQGNVRKFIAALVAGGVDVNITNALRPPQRSYLMYYAREVSSGRLDPDKVPAFEPRNGDAMVYIDWQHLGEDGKPSLQDAREAAKKMDRKYNAAEAIGRPYNSNHNGGMALDMRFSPGWGAGKTVSMADGAAKLILGKRDIIDVGAGYGVKHWDLARKKRKEDNPHWSMTGN